MTTNELIGSAAAVLTLVGSAVNAFMVLYVKSQISPLVERTKSQGSNIRRIWGFVGEHDRDLAALKAKNGHCSHCPTDNNGE